MLEVAAQDNATGSSCFRLYCAEWVSNRSETAVKQTCRDWSFLGTITSVLNFLSEIKRGSTPVELLLVGDEIVQGWASRRRRDPTVAATASAAVRLGRRIDHCKKLPAEFRQQNACRVLTRCGVSSRFQSQSNNARAARWTVRRMGSRPAMSGDFSAVAAGERSSWLGDGGCGDERRAPSESCTSGRVSRCQPRRSFARAVRRH